MHENCKAKKREEYNKKIGKKRKKSWVEWKKWIHIWFAEREKVNRKFSPLKREEWWWWWCWPQIIKVNTVRLLYDERERWLKANKKKNRINEIKKQAKLGRTWKMWQIWYNKQRRTWSKVVWFKKKCLTIGLILRMSLLNQVYDWKQFTRVQPDQKA